ncbi:hypothetical protein [Shewanella algidipiscicola]|uniref:Uncharacterized protein n=1 Tax=Shewanella algidipiscicola TaxID=614070 RepID=A0ABQ4NSR8_9GAMM|nr:hypothetical protein [Shewanella algidipiscicola]GIU02297.1 hypothetical protein TUM4630_33470 [Shewanella algidipiscicola]
MIVLVGSILTFSSVVMGNMAFRAGLGVKRWALLGLLIGPAGYPLLATHKRLAIKRAQGKGAAIIRL